jgi:ubiquitin-like domain-containing CTD phosphatase 1
MILFDTTASTVASTASSVIDYPFSESNLRYRSDDDQRTLASGQILLSSMFEPELRSFWAAYGRDPIIAHHTGDRLRDILSGEYYSCPSVQQAQQRASQSHEYQSFYRSKEAVMMRQLIQNELVSDGGNEYDLLDCMMTTICTDRILPDAINDYTSNNTSGGRDDNDKYTKKYGPNRFERLMNYVSVIVDMSSSKFKNCCLSN